MQPYTCRAHVVKFDLVLVVIEKLMMSMFLLIWTFSFLKIGRINLLLGADLVKV